MTDPDDAFRAELLAVIPALRAYARVLTGDPARADDLAQETLLKAWSHRSTYALGTRIKSWAYRIMRNCFLSDARRSWRTEPLDPEAEDKLPSAADPARSLELKDVAAALQRLSPEHREALVLVAADGLSYQEASAVIGTSVGTVKSRVSRARDRLGKLLA